MLRPGSRISPAYDAASLERAALDYAARYATTQAKLAAYLARKLRERGWAGDGAPPVDALVARFCELGYVDDEAFAAARTDALLRRGYGARRIGDALRAAGIQADITESMAERIEAEAREAVMRYARRKRIGPYAANPGDPAQRRRWVASMARAGHSMNLILQLLDIDPATVNIEDAGLEHEGGGLESE